MNKALAKTRFEGTTITLLNPNDKTSCSTKDDGAFLHDEDDPEWMRLSQKQGTTITLLDPNDQTSCSTKDDGAFLHDEDDPEWMRLSQKQGSKVRKPPI
ncbi:hypothetical protein C4D60_Mb07t12520 [Musa balbisiana]|uniref:Uncharacterized protein n=1 Tax=Musa balbisiana TaxID=52838 RepID=A0A4S8JF21_MUSBA|nr:hypothetical protein C4D60_Mb07t12520 [Musa balbisiana]